jgi:hypothetical protein
MKDVESQLDRMRRDAEECAMISRLAGSHKKKELFARLAEHLRVLASELERTITERKRDGTA